MEHSIWAWAGFLGFILLMLAVDLGLFRKDDHVVKVREAMIWSSLWVSLALTFNVILYFWQGPEPALEFLTGYLIEYSLSVDNIFVFVIIFNYFATPPALLHRVLFWGVLTAIVLRAIFIFAGIALIAKFHWTIYVFGAFLIFTGVKLFFEEGKEIEPEKNRVLRLVKKTITVKDSYVGRKFFVKENGKLVATPLFVVLLMIETSDVIFAADSIPAILAVTSDPFIVFTSNIFAILGLRSLFFALAGIMNLFHFLHYGLAMILIFVGGKMALSDLFHVPIWASLAVIGGILVLSVVLSIFLPKKVSHQEQTQK